MEVGAHSFSYRFLLQLLLLLLNLVFINGGGALARHIPDDPITTTTPTPLNHPQRHHAMEQPSSVRTRVFLPYDDLIHPGGKTPIPLYFPPKTPSKTPQFLPREDADLLPFSLASLPFLLHFFNFTPNSPQAIAVEETIAHCESPPIRDEFKFCPTSLESMLDGVRARFGPGFRPNLLTTSWVNDQAASGLGMYRVVGDPVEIKGTDMVACHALPYPFAVFYCHGQSDRESYRLFRMEMERVGGEKEVKSGGRFRVMAMCHMDTSDWSTDHVGFRLLGVEPGKAPVCHIFPPDNLVWVPVPLKSSALSSLVE